MSKNQASEKSSSNVQQATAAGGSAINTSLFIQNSLQLKKLMSLKFCSVATDKSEPGLKCDSWHLQTLRYKSMMIGISLSLLLGLLYGILTIAEYQFLRRMKAVEQDTDDEDAVDNKIQKTIKLRTVTACLGFTLALLNIGIEAFVDFK